MKNIIRQLLVFFVFVVSLNLAAQTLPVITGQVKCQGRGVANVVVTNGFVSCFDRCCRQIYYSLSS